MSYNSTYTGAEIDDAVGKVLNGSVPKADKVGHTLTINGTSFDGSVDRTITITASGGSAVTGVKGAAESSYRTGNVNLTVANLGINASTTELNYCKGVTSAIQTQLNNTVKLTGNQTIAGEKTFTGNATFTDGVWVNQYLLYEDTNSEEFILSDEGPNEHIRITPGSTNSTMTISDIVTVNSNVINVNDSNLETLYASLQAI